MQWKGAGDKEGEDGTGATSALYKSALNSGALQGCQAPPSKLPKKLCGSIDKDMKRGEEVESRALKTQLCTGSCLV